MLVIEELIRHYAALCTQVPLRPVGNGDEHAQAVAALNALLDAGASEENHPLASLVEILGDLIEDYEEFLLLQSASTPAGVLRFLLEQHNLAQADLPEIGSQGVVSEILAGKRALNIRQIRALASRFSVSPTVFMEERHHMSTSRVTSKAGSS
jgi:HTH-type transcriptional regulator/antitoxin HigA